MKSKNKTLKLFLLSAVALGLVFLLLPVFFASEQAKIATSSDGDAAALPVIAGSNPLSKYFKKLADFYGPKARPPRAASARAGDGLLPEPSANLTDEERAQIFAANAARAKAAKAGGGNGDDASSTVNGAELRAEEAGYRYDGQYYKNGTYPAGANAQLKKNIESAISRQHNARAAKEGKTAAYMQQPDGSLLVKYMPRESLAALLAGGAKPDAVKMTIGKSDAKDNAAYYADGSRYQGATIGSKGASLGSGSSRGRGGASSGSLNGDIASAYGAAGQKYASMQSGAQNAAAEQQAQQEQPQQEQDARRHEEEEAFLSNLVSFDPMVFWDPPTAAAANPLPEKMEYEKFSNAPIVMDSTLATQLGRQATTLLENLDIAFEKKDLTPDVMAELKEQGDVRIFEGNKGFATYRREKLEEQNGKLFFDYLRVPNYKPVEAKSYDPQNPPEVQSFRELFFEGNGMKQLLLEMGAPEGRVDGGEHSVGTGYDNLDNGRKRIMEAVNQAIDRNPNIRDKNMRVKVLYVLGREGDNVVVATRYSSLNATAPFSAIDDGYFGRSSRPTARYVTTTVGDITRFIDDKNYIGVVFAVTNDGKPTRIGNEIVQGLAREYVENNDPANISHRVSEVFSGMIDAIAREGYVEESKRLSNWRDKIKQASNNIEDATNESSGGVRDNTVGYVAPIVVTGKRKQTP